MPDPVIYTTLVDDAGAALNSLVPLAGQLITGVGLGGNPLLGPTLVAFANQPAQVAWQAYPTGGDFTLDDAYYFAWYNDGGGAYLDPRVVLGACPKVIRMPTRSYFGGGSYFADPGALLTWFESVIVQGFVNVIGSLCLATESSTRTSSTWYSSDWSYYRTTFKTYWQTDVDEVEIWFVVDYSDFTIYNPPSTLLTDEPLQSKPLKHRSDSGLAVVAGSLDRVRAGIEDISKMDLDISINHGEAVYSVRGKVTS